MILVKSMHRTYTHAILYTYCLAFYTIQLLNEIKALKDDKELSDMTYKETLSNIEADNHR